MGDNKELVIVFGLFAAIIVGIVITAIIKDYFNR
jgi:hypothetical protein